MQLPSFKTLCLLALTQLPASLTAALPVGTWRPQPIHWRDCGNAVPPGLDCADVKVPMNWTDQNGVEITLALIRLRSTGPGKKNLLANPGGPGAPTWQWNIANAGDPTYDKLKEHYNIIAVDPRGVGGSNPIDCDESLWSQPIRGATLYPKTESEFEALVAHDKVLGESCLAKGGSIMYHIDTASVARDFDAIRQCLGDKKLNFLAMSYGTQIAAQYAELFPENVGRFVLDGVVDHSGSEESVIKTPLKTLEQTFARRAKWCEGHQECEFRGGDVTAKYEKLVAAADEKPIPAPGCDTTTCPSSVTGEDIRDYAVGQIYEPDRWATLGSALHQASNGNAAIMSQHAPVPSNDNFADRAIVCLDWQHSVNSLSDVLKREELVKSTGPHVLAGGSSSQYNQQLGCIGWPAPVTNPQPNIAKPMDGVPPMLLVNSLYDPATSYEMAVAVHKRAPNSVLVTRDGDGHTSYQFAGEATKIVDAFLVDGILPEGDVTVDS